MRRFVLVLGALLAAGCNFKAELDEYCTETQKCTQAADGQYCVTQGHACQQGDCCEGLVCTSSGTCASGATLSVNSTSLDFGHFLRASNTVLRQPVVVTNSGTVPTGTLRVEFAPGTPPLFSVEAADCAGRVLAPGAQCTVQVAYVPRQGGKVEAELLIDHALPSTAHRISVRGLVGVPLSVVTEDATVEWVPEAVGRVISEPAGLYCYRNGGALSEGCTAYFALDESVTLRALAPEGYGFVEWGGACQGTESQCTFTVTGEAQVRARFGRGLIASVETVDDARGAIFGPASYDMCLGTCTYYVTGQVTLTAPTSDRDAFLGWGGDCSAAGDAPTCTLDVSGFRRVTARFAPLNRMVVAQLPAAQIGADLAGADAECQRVGASPDRPDGQFRAWLSTPSQSAAARLGDARGWRNLEGMPFADTVEGLVAGRIFYPPASTWDWLSQPAIVTGTTAQGVASGATCGGWTGGATEASVGHGYATTGSWTQDLLAPAQACTDTIQFYCFGTRYRSPVRFPIDSSTRLAFLSTPWTPAGGVAAADAHCQQDAAAAGLTGRFQALLAPVGVRLDERLDVFGRRCRRVDGVTVGGCTYPDVAPLNVTAQGQYVGSSGDVASARFVWTGGSGRTRGSTTPADTCNDWMGGAGATGKVGRPEFTEPQAAEVGGLATARISCSSPQRLSCVQIP